MYRSGIGLSAGAAGSRFGRLLVGLTAGLMVTLGGACGHGGKPLGAELLLLLSGGGQGGATDLRITGLEETSPTALTPLTVNTAGLDAAQAVTITLTGPSGYSAVLKPIRVGSNDSIVVAMPLYFDPATRDTGRFTGTLAISQGPRSSAPVAVTIEDIPKLADYGLSLGIISRDFYDYQILSMGQQLNALRAVQGMPGNTVDTSVLQTDVEQQIINARLARKDIDRIIANNSLQIAAGTLPSGTPLVFDKSSVEIMDRISAMYLRALGAGAGYNPNGGLQGKLTGWSPNTLQTEFQKAGITVSDLKGFLEIMKKVDKVKDIAGNVRTAMSSEGVVDTMLAASSAGNVVLKIAGATDLAKVIGTIVSMTNIAVDNWRVVTDMYHVVKVAEQSGYNAAAIAVAVDQLKASKNKLARDNADLMKNMVPFAGELTQFGLEVYDAMREGSSALGAIQYVAKKDLLVAKDTLASAIGAVTSAVAQLTGPSPGQGFAPISGSVAVDSCTPSGLTLVLDFGPGQWFSAVTLDQLGSYHMLIPLGMVAANYGAANLTLSNPATGAVIASMVVNLGSLTQAGATLPVLSGLSAPGGCITSATCVIAGIPHNPADNFFFGGPPGTFISHKITVTGVAGGAVNWMIQPGVRMNGVGFFSQYYVTADSCGTWGTYTWPYSSGNQHYFGSACQRNAGNTAATQFTHTVYASLTQDNGTQAVVLGTSSFPIHCPLPLPCGAWGSVCAP